MGDNIKVSVRLRNLIAREIQSKATVYWEPKDKSTVSTVNSSSTTFSFDRVFSGDESNEVVYDDACAPIIKSVINGFNGTIFAYGQTSSGKTYTLMGDGKFEFGIAHRSVCNLFDYIQNMADREFLLRVSLMEIYNNEKVIDLLAKKPEENLKLQDDQYGICKVLNLTESEVQEPNQVLDLLRKGQKRRKTGETVQNQRSSRSHLIFRMIIESRLRDNENAAVKVSHFNIVDLAGSEKPSENASGTRFKEGVNINTSLLMLSQVINQLSAEKESQFINYRASKLTRILKNSLGGNALTAIICNITPASYDETLSTLKFALNAKKIKNKPHVNEVETEETLIRSYANKIKLLTKQLEATKEEKDQEAKKRRDMQEQIEALKKKFVQLSPQKSMTRTSRRETWGGSLDLIRMKNHFQPSRPLKLAVVDEENEVTTDFLDIDKTFNSEFFRNRMSTVSSINSIDLNADEYSKKEDVAVQTDFLQNDKPCSELNSKIELLKLYQDKIDEISEELSHLGHFTTLEKQMYVVHSSKTKNIDKSARLSTLSPLLEKHRLSDANNLSLDEDSFGVIDCLVNRKSQADRNVMDLDKEMFFQNLNIVIEKLSNILNVETLLPSIANPYFKVIFQLASIIFQKQFMGNEVLIDEQVKEMFTLLTKIFAGFSNEEDSIEQNSDLIIHFDEVSEKLLKDIEKLSASSDTVTCTETKIANSDLPDIINVSCCESPDTNPTLYSCQCYNQINMLEETIQTHLETINNLQIDQESLKEQVALSEEKIKIKEQSIANLEKEIKNKIECCAVNVESSNINPTAPSCLCRNQMNLLEETIKTHLETIHHLGSDQESLKKQVTFSEDKIKMQEQDIASLKNEIKIKVGCCAELTDKFTQTSYMAPMNRTSFEPSEMPSGLDYDSKIKEKSCSNCSKPQDYSAVQSASGHELSDIKKELSDLRLLAQNMMESSMPKAYYSDINESEALKILESNSFDSVKVELAALKSRLHKIKFYLKDRSEHSEILESKILNLMTEISSLQRQCSSTEMTLQEKKNQLDSLNADITEFRKEISERKLSITTMGVNLKCLDFDDIKSFDNLSYIKRTMQCFADAVVDCHNELCQYHVSKQNKNTQTVENYPDLAALEEVRTIEYNERMHLCQENASLKLKVENLERDLRLKEQNISDIQKSYDNEVEQSLTRRKKLEENLMETMQKHIKDIEDKYEEELKNQEKSLFEMMDEKLSSLRDKYNLEQEKKQDHYETLISELTAKCETIKSELQSKLTEEINSSEETRLKLGSEIRDFKIREESSRQAYYKLKDKFKEYVKSVQAMRMNNAKCVKEKETQTNTESRAADVCNECKTLKREQQELKTMSKLKNQEMASLESINKNMMREVAALKKDLAAKSALLSTCNCRLIAKPQDMVRGATNRTKISDCVEPNQDKNCKKTALDPKEVLKLDFVQEAINEAKESERAIFNSGEGPASQEMCILLKRKLAKKDKEISDLKNILSQKQIKVAQNPVKKLNLENIPMNPIDIEVMNNFTPVVKSGGKHNEEAVPKVQQKNILSEINKPENTKASTNNWFMTEEEAQKVEEMDENLRQFKSGNLECKQQ